MRFSPSFLDEIRDRLPISSVIGTRVAWDRRKTNASRGDWWACCPFHGEKTPSFHCEDRKGRYHCFGCGASGDHFRFLTDLDGLSFPEAVERVAEMAGVAMPARDEASEARERQRATLSDVMELAASFFQERLQAADGARARAYLRGRGLAPATQQAFRLGYAPDSRNALKEYLAAKGVAKEQVEACGLVVHGPDIAVSYDRFRDRVMFPIEDARGRVIAFGGRALSPDVPAKYLNSNDTELFHKGSVLYNFARARKGQAKAGAVIAVEGYMDVIALAQAGFDNAVAPLGTALTESQLELLWRVAGEPVLCFDGDEAGMKAAWRAADLALPLIAPGRSLRFALLPQGQDPDDLLRQGGKEALSAVLDQARPLAEMLWLRETGGGVFDTPERRAELERTLRELAGRIRDESVRRHYQQDMRERVAAFFGRSSRQGAPGRQERGQGRGERRPGRLLVSDRLARSPIVARGLKAPSLRESAVLVALVNFPSLLDHESERILALEFDSEAARLLHSSLLDIHVHGRDGSRAEVMEALAERGLAAIVEQLTDKLKGVYSWPFVEGAAFEDAAASFSQTLSILTREIEIGAQQRAIAAALATTEDAEEAAGLVEELRQLSEAAGALAQLDALVEGYGVMSGKTRLTTG